MFAVIRTGGKQYKVAKDDVIAVEKLAGEPGATIELGEVLMLGDGATVSAGTPLLSGASVSATLVEQRRADKIIIFKKKRRQNYRRKKGHRQYQTLLRITEINAESASGADVSTGTPLLDGASVSATLVEHRRTDKIIVFKKKRRQNYRRKNGHRQHQTVLQITEIRLGGQDAAVPRRRARTAAPEQAPAQEVQDGA